MDSQRSKRPCTDWSRVDLPAIPGSSMEFPSTSGFGHVGMSRPNANNSTRTSDNNPSNMGLVDQSAIPGSSKESPSTSGFGYVGMSRPNANNFSRTSDNNPSNMGLSSTFDFKTEKGVSTRWPQSSWKHIEDMQRLKRRFEVEALKHTIKQRQAELANEKCESTAENLKSLIEHLSEQFVKLQEECSKDLIHTLCSSMNPTFNMMRVTNCTTLTNENRREESAHDSTTLSQNESSNIFSNVNTPTAINPDIQEQNLENQSAVPNENLSSPTENFEVSNKRLPELYEILQERWPKTLKSRLNIWTGRNLIKDIILEERDPNSTALPSEESWKFHPVTILKPDNSKDKTEKVLNGNVSSRDISVFTKVMQKVSDQEHSNHMKCTSKTEYLNKVFYDIMDELDLPTYSEECLESSCREENESISPFLSNDNSSASDNNNNGACPNAWKMVDKIKSFVPGKSFYSFESKEESNNCDQDNNNGACPKSWKMVDKIKSFVPRKSLYSFGSKEESENSNQNNGFRVYKNPSSVEVYYSIPNDESIFRPTIKYAQSLYLQARSSQLSSSLWDCEDLKDVELQIRRSSLGLVLDIVSFVNNTVNVLYEKNRHVSQEDTLEIVPEAFQYRQRDFKAVKFWKDEKTVYSDIKSRFDCYQFSSSSPYANIDLHSIPQCTLKPLWYSRDIFSAWNDIKFFEINHLWELLSFINILITRKLEEVHFIDHHIVLELINYAMRV